MIALIYFVVSYLCGAWTLYSFCKNCEDFPKIYGGSPDFSPDKIVELNLLSILAGWYFLIKFIMYRRGPNDFIRPVYEKFRFGLRFWKIKPLSYPMPISRFPF